VTGRRTVHEFEPFVDDDVIVEHHLEVETVCLPVRVHNLDRRDLDRVPARPETACERLVPRRRWWWSAGTFDGSGDKSHS
jgi:hypothetical protein